MKGRFLLHCALACALLLGIAVYAGRLLRLSGDWALDLGGGDMATLSPATRHFLADMEDDLSIAFFVSKREKMPSHLVQVEPQVRRLLEALADAAPGHLDYRVLYPDESGPAGIAYAARHRASSFSVRRVVGDEHAEEKIWSSLVLAYGERPEVLVQSIDATHLPHLEELVIAHLQALDKAPVPTFAVAASGPFQLLSAFLNEHGRVLEIDLDRQPQIPAEADLLFWVQPAAITPEHLRQLRRFLDAGRSAVLAGSAYEVGYLPAGESVRYLARPLSSAWEHLLRPFGLRPLPDLLMDANTGPLLLDLGSGQVREVTAPFHLRCLPAFYDMKSFRLPARGGLAFAGASALDFDPEKVAAAGFAAQIVGTTTENAFVRALPSEPFTDADLRPELRVPRQNLMLLLEPDDPWKGQVFALASAAPLRDGIINQPGYAHRIFLDNLVRTFAAPERLVRARLERHAPARLPPLTAGERLFWRFAAVFLVPLALLAIGTWRYLSGGSRPRPEALSWLCIRVGGGLLALVVGGLLWKGAGRLYLDLSADELNTPAPLTRQLLERHGQGLRAELAISPRAAMPPALKEVEPRVRALLAEHGVEVEVLRPEDLPPAGQQALLEEGLRPFAVERVLHDTLVAQTAWSGLVLRRQGRSAVVPRLDERRSTHLEFLLAAALQRLESGRAPRLAIVSDLPRLSPAEALEDYQRKGLIAPTGADVYSELKSLLRDYLYEVEYINPRDPQLPSRGADVLVWMQPRRDSSPVAALLGEHLAGGGRAIVALQHFNIQQRQYRGSGFQTVYWPQPQFQDLDPFLKPLGIELVREVLMDRTRAHLDLETQVNRTAVREYDAQKVALPFLVRAVGAHYDRASPITRRLGDLLFVWGNRFALDPGRLAALGLEHRALVATSPRAWSFAWQGGWLPPETFSADAYLPGSQPLAVLIEGAFPRTAPSAEGWTVRQPGHGRGALLLVGCSEMFKNEYLYAPDYQHDQFLLNAVAYMAYGEQLAGLQARRPAVRGFPHQSPVARAIWRTSTLAAGPLAFLFYGLWRYRRRYRPLSLP